MQEDDNAIEKIYITASDAFNKFKDKHVDLKTTDFLDTFLDKKKIEYNLWYVDQL